MDLKEVVQSLNGGEEWSLSSIILDVAKISDHLDDIEFKSYPPKFQKGAHCLAEISYSLSV